MEIFLLFKTDVWHTHDSKELIAIGTTLEGAINLAVFHAKVSGDELTQEQLGLLRTIKQTQGYCGEGEYLIQNFFTGMLL